MKYKSVTKFASQGEESSSAKLISTIVDYAKHELRDRNPSSTQFTGIVNLDKTEKALRINELFKEVLQSRAGVTLDQYSGDVKEYANNPNVVAMEQFLKKIMIEAIKPTIINSTGLAMLAEIQYLEDGGVAEFVLQSYRTYDVTEMGDRQKHVDAQQRLKNTKTVTMKQYGLTTITNLPEIWANEAMVAEDVVLMALSISEKIYKLALQKFLAVSADTVIASKYVAGSYAEKAWLTKLKMITAVNGKRPTIIGDVVALKDLLPASANTRILLQDEYNNSRGFVAEFNTYPVMAFDPVYDKDGTNELLGFPENRLFAMSTDSKPIKVAIGRAMTNADGEWDNNDLSRRTTMRQEIGVDIATCEKIAVCKLS